MSPKAESVLRSKVPTSEEKSGSTKPFKPNVSIKFRRGKILSVSRKADSEVNMNSTKLQKTQQLLNVRFLCYSSGKRFHSK